MSVTMKKSNRKQEGDEHEALIKDKTTSYDDGNYHQRQSSRLEWAESSWTRWLHVLCWWWMNPILSTGYKRSLTDNDLDDIPHIDKSSVLLNRLHSHDWASTTMWKIIIREFWKEYILEGLFFIPFLISRSAESLLLRQIVLSIMNEKESNTITYLYVILLFISASLQSICERQIMFRMNRVGTRIRNALTSIIYERSLSMKSTSCQQMTTGQIINLIANDTSRYEEVCKYLHFIWAGPLEAVIIFGFLCWVMRPIPTICAFALFPLFALIQWQFSRKFREYRVITTSCADKRIHAFNEFIHGSQIVKMYNWETLMEDRIRQLRQDELASIKRTSRLEALNMSQFFVSTPL